MWTNQRGPCYINRNFLLRGLHGYYFILLFLFEILHRANIYHWQIQRQKLGN